MGDRDDTGARLFLGDYEPDPELEAMLAAIPGNKAPLQVDEQGRTFRSKPGWPPAAGRAPGRAPAQGRMTLIGDDGRDAVLRMAAADGAIIAEQALSPERAIELGLDLAQTGRRLQRQAAQSARGGWGGSSET